MMTTTNFIGARAVSFGMIDGKYRMGGTSEIGFCLEANFSKFQCRNDVSPKSEKTLKDKASKTPKFYGYI